MSLNFYLITRFAFPSDAIERATVACVEMLVDVPGRNGKCRPCTNEAYGLLFVKVSDCDRPT
jgi:hypothetical protein